MEPYSDKTHFIFQENLQIPPCPQKMDKKAWLKQVLQNPIQECVHACNFLSRTYKVNPERNAIQKAMVNLILDYEKLDILHTKTKTEREEIKRNMGSLHQMASRLGGTLQSERILDRAIAILIEHFDDYLTTLNENESLSHFGFILKKNSMAIENRLSKSDKELWGEIKKLFIQRNEEEAEKKLIVLAEKINILSLKKDLNLSFQETNLTSFHILKDPNLNNFLMCIASSPTLCLEMYDQLSSEEKKAISPTNAKEILLKLEEKRFRNFLRDLEPEKHLKFVEMLKKAGPETHKFISYLMDHGITFKDYLTFLDKKIENKELTNEIIDFIRSYSTSKKSQSSGFDLFVNAEKYYINSFTEMFRQDHLELESPTEHDSFAWMLMNRRQAQQESKPFKYTSANKHIPISDNKILRDELNFLISDEKVLTELLEGYPLMDFESAPEKVHGPYKHVITGKTLNPKKYTIPYEESTHKQKIYTLDALLQKKIISENSLKYAFDQEFENTLVNQLANLKNIPKNELKLKGVQLYYFTLTCGIFNDLITQMHAEVKSNELTSEEAIRVLKTRIANEIQKETIKKEEEVDPALFKDLMGELVLGGKGDLAKNIDPQNPTIKKYIKEYNDGSWKDGEFRPMPFSAPTHEEMNAYLISINELWKQPNFQEVLRRYFSS